jgi:predicted nucleotidyltransferase
MTALEMSKPEMRKRAREFVLHKRASARPTQYGGRAELLAAVRLWAAEVHDRYPDVSVFLFGSLASAGRWRGDASDIDLAVEGLCGAEYWQVWKLAEEMLTGRSVDLIDLEMATSSLRSAVAKSGIEL